MTARSGSRTTICITTLDRPAFVERTLRYYRDEGFGGFLLIGDGSTGAAGERVRRSVADHARHLQVECIDGSNMTQASLMREMASRVSTPFAVYSGDDDFLVPAALADCEEFLDAHPEFVSAHGTGVAMNADGAHGVPTSLDPYRLPNLIQELALQRLEHFMDHYSVGIFAVHRAAAWREMFADVHEMPDKAIAGEVAPCVISAVLGRCAQIGGLYLVRQIHTRRYHLPLQDQWLLDPRFAESLRRLLAQVRKLIARTDRDLDPGQIGPRTWRATMGYFYREFGPDPVPSRPKASTLNSRPLEQGQWLNGTDEDARRFQGVFRSMLGDRPLEARKPRMLLSWGNPYVIDEAITPILPALSQRFSIVLLLVNYRLAPALRERAFSWKDAGLVEDVIIAPSHGGSMEAHVFMRQLVPAIQRLDIKVFLSISAMQPYERYLIECALPPACLRILFWPHPTNLFLYPELGRALVSGAARAEIDRVVVRLRDRVEPSIRRELTRPSPGLLRVWGFFAVAALGRAASALGRRLSGRRTEADDEAASRATALIEELDTSGSPVTRFLLRNPWIRPYGQRVTKVAPAVRYWVEDIARAAHRLYQAYRTRARVSEAKQYGAAYGAWLAQWPILHSLNVARTEQHFPYTLDRLIYPQILVGKRFPFRRTDWITQIGTDDFDACLFFNEQDTELHKRLFDNPNMYTVRYVPRERAVPPEPVDAVLHPFSIYGKSDLTPGLLETYRRDLAIALKESGAAEVHIRPHPGALTDWLEFLVGELRVRGIPCRLVPASRPISEVAANYKGVISAVSGSLRDARLACPEIFVVGSVGLSIAVFEDPKHVVGFPESIGWIEADGTYDPRIFRPAAQDMQRHPTAVDVVNRLVQGSWERKPSRLAGAAPALAHAPSTPLSP